MVDPSPRLCFVIMPFSDTNRCTESQWTQVFEEIIKPAVEGDERLGFECRRSTATRGNLVRGIMEDLQLAYVVIADLTDRNANVFYELGVRHTLTDRTILIAQDRADIPFDVGSYASHVYDWKSDRDRADFTTRIRALLREVDEKPDRPDNPVSDFLNLSRPEAGSVSASAADRLNFLEEQVLTLGRQVATLYERFSGTSAPSAARELDDWLARKSSGPIPDAYTMRDVATRLAAPGNAVLARSFIRRLAQDAMTQLEARITELNKSDDGQINRQEILPKASEFLAQVLPIVDPVEQFALACVEAGFAPGLAECVKLAGKLVSLEERSPGGVRFAVGLPGFLALRLLLLVGAKAVEDERYDLAALVVNEPLEVRLVGGQTSHKPLWAQRSLFFPEAFLGYADIPMAHFDVAWGQTQYLPDFFPSEASYRASLVAFLVLLALRHTDADGHQFYPGYRLLTDARETVRSLTSRLQANMTLREQFAKTLRESIDEFTQLWPQRATRINEAQLGGRYFDFWQRFPESLDDPTNRDADG